MIDLQNIDINIIERKIADLPVPAILAKELSVLIPTIVQEHKGQFAVALAHEIRNPLTNINLAVEMLKAGIMNGDQKMYLDIIMRASVRINDLVKDLLIASHTGSKQLENHNINELLDEVIELAKDRIALKHIVVNKYYTAVQCILSMDRQKLKIALSNIVINSIEAMPGRGGELKLLTKFVNGKCVVEISDNGMGISKENMEHIFKPYFTSKPGGMGLGLSTTLDTLLLNHAKLLVKSKVGEGSSFIISFGKSLETIPA